MVTTTTCRYCRKSEALDAPAAGYIYEDHEWLVAHAPPDAGHAGTLVVSSRRHFLDMTEMTDDEVLSFAALLRRLVPLGPGSRRDDTKPSKEHGAIDSWAVALDRAALTRRVSLPPDDSPPDHKRCSAGNGEEADGERDQWEA